MSIEGRIILRPKVGTSYRYAKAFLSVLSLKQQADFVKKIEALQISLNELLSHTHFRNLPLKDQEDILQEWAQQWNAPFFHSLIKLVLENHREHRLEEILQCIYEEYCDQQNLHNITVTTAKPLKKNDKKTLTEFLKDNVSAQEVIQGPAKGTIKYIFDESILGGTIIQIDGKQKDESLRTYLQDIQTQLMEAL